MTGINARTRRSRVRNPAHLTDRESLGKLSSISPGGSPRSTVLRAGDRGGDRGRDCHKAGYGLNSCEMETRDRELTYVRNN